MEAENQKTKEEFEDLFNKTFKDLYDFKKKIDVRCSSSYENDYPLEVKDINGYKNSSELNIDLGIIINNGLDKINSFSNINIIGFYDFTIKKIQEYYSIVEKHEQFYTFKNFFLHLKNEIYYSERIGEDLTLDKSDVQNLLRTLDEFCKVWISNLSDFKKNVKDYMGNVYKSAKEDKINKINNKLKIKLSVAELAYLFKVLDYHDLIDKTHNTDIYQFLADNFQTKGKKDKEVQSSKSIKNDFDSPEMKTIVFWDDKFEKFKKYTEKNK